MTVNDLSTIEVCAYCGREVGAYPEMITGKRMTVLMGHRTEMPHTIETPWCQGGGRPILNLFPISATTDAQAAVSELDPASAGSGVGDNTE